MNRFIWLLKGMPKVSYDGFHCGLCGKWVNQEFSIPAYRSYGRWADTIGICLNCAGGGGVKWGK